MVLYNITHTHIVHYLDLCMNTHAIKCQITTLKRVLNLCPVKGNVYCYILGTKYEII